MIRVLLVQAADVIRSALAAVLDHEPDLKVVGELAFDDDRAGVVEALGVDVMIVNYGAGEAGAAQWLTTEVAGCAVLVLIGQATREALTRAVKGRAGGFLDVDTPPSELVRAIRRVAAGEWVIDPSLVASAVQQSESPLTPREHEVLQAVADGLRSEEIAERLYLAPGTVRNYLSIILRKTGARTRLEAVRKARDSGWL